MSWAAETKLVAATAEELEQALAHALQYDGRRSYRLSGDMMAKIAAAHLAACLTRAGFIVMKMPPAEAHRYKPDPVDPA